MSKIITLGELLIDLTQQGTDENGNGKFVAYPGGAPANVAVAASRLGAETAFIGKVGDDAFGRSLADTLQKDNVDISGLYYSETTPTTMAIVSVDENGERDFSFYRKPGADIMLTGDESVSAVRKHADKGARILHIGSLSMTDSPAREACIAAVELAKEKGMLISYDPNYRAALWDSEEQAVSEMKSLLPYADILKVSDEELLMLSGTDDFEKGSAILQTMGRGADDEGISLIMVTLGADGVFVRSSTGSCCAAVPGFKVKVADTNGAGDTFLGAMLAQIVKNESILFNLGWDALIDMVRYANRAASITCSRHGAIPAMPRAEELSSAQ